MDKRIAWAAWSVYALLVCASIARGGMWLDEMQVWGVARDTNGFLDLFHEWRNEGHPPLWPMLVKLFAVPFGHPAAMAILHGLFALGTAWIILFRAPWPLVARVLAVFGYFLVFEYAVNVRNYGPGMFFLFAALAAHQRGKAWTVMLLLVALALTHYWGIIVAGAWALVCGAAPGMDKMDRVRYGVVLAAAAFALYLCVPAEPLPYTPRLDRIPVTGLPDEVGRMLGQAFLPFPDLEQPRPWNTNVLLAHAPLACSILGWMILLAAFWCIRGNKRWLLFFALATVGILAFPVLAPFRSVRYYGPLIMALLCTLWMAPEAMAGAKRRIVLLLLALQVPGAIAMTIIGLHMPRSTAMEAVEWLQNGPYSELPVIVHPYQGVPAVSGYLGQQVYCPATGSLVGHCRWTHIPFRLEPAALLDSLAHSPYQRAVLLTPDRSLDGTDRNLRIVPLHDFANALIASEEHRLYLVHRIE